MNALLMEGLFKSPFDFKAFPLCHSSLFFYF